MAESTPPTGDGKPNLSTNVDYTESIHEGHVDAYKEAQRLAVRHGADHYDAQTEKRLVRKIDWSVMPLMCITYALQYYDKAILGHAAIFGIRTDLDMLVGERYSNATLIFYCGFIAGCYPLSLLSQKLPTGKVCAGICFIWGIVVMSSAACTSYTGFMANRFFLGVVESGISPAFMLVTSKWYTNKEQVLRSSIWYCCSGGINLISPLIDYGLGSITGGSLTGWQYMYLFAGSITLLWSIAIWAFLPDSPVTARRFTEEERALVILRVQRNNTGAENPHLSKQQILNTLLSYQFWAVFVMSMLCTTGSGASNTFTSLVFQGMGFDTLQTMLLNIPLGAMAIITIVGSGWIARSVPNSRHYVYAGACIPVILGCCLLWKLPSSNRAGRVAGVYLVTFFGSCYTQVISFGTSNFAGYTKKTVAAAGIFVAYCLGNIIGPLLFDAKFSPRYAESFTGIMVCFAVTFFVCLATRFMLARENRRRDAAFGPAGVSHGLQDLTEKENVDFRYQL